VRAKHLARAVWTVTQSWGSNRDADICFANKWPKNQRSRRRRGQGPLAL